MIMRGATLFSRAAAFLTILLAMTACGGGGGGSGAGFLGPAENVLTITLLDANGQETNAVSANSIGTLRVEISGNQNDSVVVTGATTLGELVSQTSLTDSDGVALFQIQPAGARGATTFTASATIDATPIDDQISFQLGATGLRLGRFESDGTFVEGEISTLPTSTLAANGNAELSVNIFNPDGSPVSTPELVNFTSGCISGGQASLAPESPVTSVNGIATVQYTPNGCTGNDQVTASLVGAVAQAFTTLTVASAQANNISFVSAEPTLIVLKGTGGAGRDETSDVEFLVTDGSGATLTGIRIEFSLSTEVGGLAVTPAVGFTNSEGLVTATVASGDVATSARVIASVSDGNGGQIATASDLIVVSTGLPDQNSISLSVSEAFVVTDGMRVDGITRSVTVRMADKFNNPVVDGTAAVFTTEYGAIDPSCQTGVANGTREGGTPVTGQCSVQWTSQEPRFPTLSGTQFIETIYDPDYSCPSHNGSSGPCPDFLGHTGGGRSDLLVHAIGEESFVDRNGNGKMDQDEANLFDNLPEAFIDHNEDGVYTPATPDCLADPSGSRLCIAGREEIFIDFDNDEEYDFNDDPAVYNGLLCPPEGDGVWCSRELVNVRDSHRLILGDNYEILVERNGFVVRPEFAEELLEKRSYDVHIADTFNNPPAAGSTITYSAEGNCSISGLDEFEVENTTQNHAYTTPLGILVTNPISPTGGSVTITLTLDDDSTVAKVFNCEPGIDCDNTFSPKPAVCPPDPNDP